LHVHSQLLFYQVDEAQAQQGAQAQRITRSMARALGQEYNKMALLISFIE